MNKFQKFLLNHDRLALTTSKIYNIINKNIFWKLGKNNKIQKNNSFFKSCKIIIKGKNNEIIFGKYCVCRHMKIMITGNNNKIIIGNRMYNNFGEFYFEDDNNCLLIGENVTFAGTCHLALTEGKKIEIGNRCLFSSNVTFRTGDSHPIVTLNNERINYAKDIYIGDHVWVCNQVIVLKGSYVNNNSIIGSGTLLCKQITKENVIIAGNPGKIIKENINWKDSRLD